MSDFQKTSSTNILLHYISTKPAYFLDTSPFTLLELKYAREHQKFKTHFIHNCNLT